MMANLKEIAKLQKETVELLKEAKTEEAIAKIEASADLIIKETEKEKEVSKTKEIDISKTIEAEIKKYADIYFAGEDLKSILTQIIEASELTKKIEEISKEIEDIKKTETESKQVEVTKTDDPNSIWAGL